MEPFRLAVRLMECYTKCGVNTMDAGTREMLKAILSGMEGLEERLNSRIAEESRGIKVIIENDVGKRIVIPLEAFKRWVSSAGKNPYEIGGGRS